MPCVAWFPWRNSALEGAPAMTRNDFSSGACYLFSILWCYCLTGWLEILIWSSFGRDQVVPMAFSSFLVSLTPFDSAPTACFSSSTWGGCGMALAASRLIILRHVWLYGWWQAALQIPGSPTPRVFTLPMLRRRDVIAVILILPDRYRDRILFSSDVSAYKKEFSLWI